ncbi:MAG: amino acid transporter permease, partial [Polaromonas sp.]|nr:amino acid transporter permease [Polaromonas sp.]
MSVRPFLATALAALMLYGCGTDYTWGWYVVSPWTDKGQTSLKFLISGLGWTVLLASCAISLSVAAGLLISLLSMSKHKAVRAVGVLYVEGLRAIPMLVMVLWVYYGLPVVLGIELDVFSAGVLALALCDSAFEAEIFRAGIQS